MHTLRYTNRVLTVVAVLLTLNLYAQFTAAGPSTAAPARADSLAKGVGSQAARQAEIAKGVQQIGRTVEAMNQALTDGSVRVKVENFPAEK